MPRPQSLATAGHFPTPPRVAAALAEILAGVDPDYYEDGYYADQGWYRLLDPCCADGAALQTLARRMDEEYYLPLTTYGIELNYDRAQAATENLQEVLAADLFASAVAADAFSLLFLNPPYDYNQEGGRAENAFLEKATPALLPNGLLLFLIPQGRLASCQDFLANWYQDLTCFSFPDPEYDRFQQVVVFGRRKAEPFPDPAAAARIQEWQATRPPPLPPAEAFPHPAGTTLPAAELPPGPEGAILFTDNVSLLPLALAEAAAGGGAWQRPEAQALFAAPKELKVTPLMPARRGQMALMAAAGLLNNLTLEDAGSRVIIKGRTTKSHELAEDGPATQKWQDRLTTTLTVLDLDSGEITEVA